MSVSDIIGSSIVWIQHLRYLWLVLTLIFGYHFFFCHRWHEDYLAPSKLRTESALTQMLNAHQTADIAVADKIAVLSTLSVVFATLFLGLLLLSFIPVLPH
ncbi:MAG: hypothetical protein NTW79_03005 [Candidatus Berkelbacteria bacterium]|nr:hypothetical protein [Candidatus Berkelbacteria bacterium]